MKIVILKYVSLVIVCMASFCVNGHPGGQDSNGGHVNRSTGEYHCHKPDCIAPSTVGVDAGYLDIISFNIQFLGNFKSRDNDALAALVSPYDVVVVQELVAPPYPGVFPDDTNYRPDLEAQQFFDAMTSRGFDFILSEEDTGTNNKIHLNSTSTEWWVTFYKPDVVEPTTELPHGYLAEDRSDNNNYERVPYAFSFKTIEGGNDFVLVSVHLKPGASKADQARRQWELATISTWVDENDEDEKDFFILGDMNFKNCAEIDATLPAGYSALNSGPDCLNTNTNVNGPRPYDNIIYPSSSATELFSNGDFELIDLVEAMRVSWFEDYTQPYPGDSPYNHNAFRVIYSDHHPIRFRIRIGDDDD